MMDLSIFIPTYNRRERLLRQLSSIVEQPLSQEVEIVVLNNNSDYDVEAAIRVKFGDAIFYHLRIINNRANLGLSMNIALPFYYCKTKWLWILSDDDVTMADSLEIIMQDMRRFDDYACLKYSLKDMSYHNDYTIESLESLVAYYEKPDKDQGEFIFISNNLFNMSKIEPFVGKIVSYSYNAIAGILPYVYLLDVPGYKVMMRKDFVVEYLLPQKGSEWNYLDITTRLITLMDYPFSSSGELVMRLMNLMNHFSFWHYLEGLINLHDKTKAKMFFQKTFPSLFKNGIKKRLLYRVAFYLYIYFNINIYPTVHPIWDRVLKCR